MQEQTLQSIRQMIRKVAREHRERSKGARFDTSDIIQESMIQVWKTLGERTDVGVSADKTVSKAWLVTVARGHAAKMARQHSAAKRDIKRDQHPQGQIADAYEAPLENLIEQEQQLRILAALDNLAEDEKEIMVLYFFEQHSQKEIAEQLGITVDQVRVRYSRALKSLYFALEEPA